MAYLVFLAWKIAQAHQSEYAVGAQPLTFSQAALFQWVNPKAWVMAVGSISSFTTPGADLTWQVAMIGISFFLANILSVFWRIF